MSKICNLSDFKKDAINKAMYEFKGKSKATSLTLSPTETNTYIITHGRGSQAIKTKEQGYNAAKSYSKRVENWAKTKFGDRYSTGWTQITSNPNFTKVTFEVPSLLMKVQEIKRAEEADKVKLIQELNSQAQLLIDADNKRAGKEFEEDGVVFKQTETSIEKVNEQIEEKMITFLNTYGINVEYVNSLKERGYDAVAIADITNKMVMISKGEASIDTLPEEAAHFAVELLGDTNPIVKRLMDIVDTTSIYNETYEQYKMDELYQLDGKPDVKKIKKETIGKAIARNIINVNKAESTNGFSRTIKKLWDKVMSMFKKVDNTDFNKELKGLTEGLATEILNNTLKGDTKNLKSDMILKSKKSIDKVSREKKRALRAIQTLEVRIKQIKSKDDSSVSSGIKETISTIQNHIDANQSLVGISHYLDGVSEGVIGIDAKIKDYRDNHTSFINNISELKDIHDFTSLHSSMIDDIYKMFEEDPYLRERGEELFNQVEDTARLISRATNFVTANMQEATKDTIHQYSENPDLAEELFEDGGKDTSFISTYLNTYKNSKDEVVRILDSILRSIKYGVNRFTLTKGREIINAQMKAERSGFKDFSVLAERTNDGKLSGNIIREHNYGEYEKSKNKLRQEIAKTLDMSYEQLVSTTLSGSNRQIMIDMWVKWHNKHSAKTKYGFTPNKSYLNKEYNKVTSNSAAKEYYDLLIANKKESLEKVPDNYNTEANLYKLPQIRKNTLQRIRSKEGKLWQNFGRTIKEDVTEAFKVQEDDTEFGHDGGEVTTNPITGEEVRFLPVHYNNSLKNMDDISLDFSSTYIAYTHMAETFKQRNAKQGEIWLIEEAVDNKKFDSSRKANKGASNLKTTVSNLVDTHFYGKEKHLNIVKYKGAISGKNREVNVTKVVDRFLGYVRNNNLAFNTFTHMTNHLMGGAYSKIEDIAGRYSTNASKLRAEIELDKNMVSVIAEIGKRRKTNKINLMLEHNGVIHDGRKMFKNLDIQNSMGRAMANTGLLSTYELSDTRIKAKMLISIYDNHRLFENNFITYKDFKVLHKGEANKEIKRKWKELSKQTLYDAYEAVDGELAVKKEYQEYISDNLQNKLTGVLEHVLNNLDGQLSQNDLTEAHRHIVGRAIMTHRNWMITGLEDRFKTGKFNYVTREDEEGYFRTFGRMFVDGFKKGEDGKLDREYLTNSMKSLILAGKDMSEEDKSNIKKVWADVTFVVLAMVLAKIFNGIADDKPDDYLAQFNGYLSTRLKLEAIALSPITIQAPFQFLDIVKSPAAGINQFESIMDGLYMLTYEGTAFDEVRSGGYKGKSKMEQLLIKRSIVKPFYETFNTESIKSKNRFIRQMGL